MRLKPPPFKAGALPKTRGGKCSRNQERCRYWRAMHNNVTFHIHLSFRAEQDCARSGQSCVVEKPVFCGNVSI